MHVGAWSLLSFGEDRHFQGNTGYADVLELVYLYDSSVQNAKRLAKGDLVVVRGKESAHGAGWVRQIAVEPGAVKVRKRCPQCGETGFKPRSTRATRFLCLECRHEFDEPAEELVPVTKYVANYAGTWQPLHGAITAKELNGIAENRSQQQSIRPLHRESLERMLRAVGVATEPPSELPVFKIDGGRRIALVSVRLGQDSFRKALLRKHGSVCAVTGACPEEALEAAHLRAFAVHESHEVDEGLLLRGDVHRLLDRGLLAVHPDTLEVQVAPRLHGYPDYLALHGRRMTASPSRQALADHYKVATASWA